MISQDFFKRAPVKFETLVFVSAGKSDVFTSLGNNGFRYIVFFFKPQQVFLLQVWVLKKWDVTTEESTYVHRSPSCPSFLLIYTLNIKLLFDVRFQRDKIFCITLLKIMVVTNAIRIKTLKNDSTSLLNWNLWIFSDSIEKRKWNEMIQSITKKMSVVSL